VETDEYTRGYREGVGRERKRWVETLRDLGICVSDGGQYRADIKSAIKAHIKREKEGADE
jgi:hypothetical protein